MRVLRRAASRPASRDEHRGDAEGFRLGGRLLRAAGEEEGLREHLRLGGSGARRRVTVSRSPWAGGARWPGRSGGGAPTLGWRPTTAVAPDVASPPSSSSSMIVPSAVSTPTVQGRPARRCPRRRRREPAPRRRQREHAVGRPAFRDIAQVEPVAGVELDRATVTRRRRTSPPQAAGNGSGTTPPHRHELERPVLPAATSASWTVGRSVQRCAREPPGPAPGARSARDRPGSPQTVEARELRVGTKPRQKAVQAMELVLRAQEDVGAGVVPQHELDLRPHALEGVPEHHGEVLVAAAGAGGGRRGHHADRRGRSPARARGRRRLYGRTRLGGSAPNDLMDEPVRPS